MTCEACRSIPPVVVQGYQFEGKYEIIAGLKTCKSKHHVGQEKRMGF